MAACHELDIEFTELVTGYRLRQNYDGDYLDIYLYDSLSSGAGYAVRIESSIKKLLTKTQALLKSCSCDSACRNCLKQYRNQHLHSILDRHAALDLLYWGEDNRRTAAYSTDEQKKLIRPLMQILRRSGVQISISGDTIFVERDNTKKKVTVYPAMWTKPTAEGTIFISDMQLKFRKPSALKTVVDSV